MTTDSALDPAAREALELLAAEAYDDAAITEVIRPAAVLPELAAQSILAELAARDVRAGGCWLAEPTTWRRYDRPWNGAAGTPGTAELLGTLQVAYGSPTKYEITVFRATVTSVGAQRNWTVTLLCDEAFGFGGLTLAGCPRAHLKPPPPPFRLR
jgi:hypothetical protein